MESLYNATMENDGDSLIMGEDRSWLPPVDPTEITFADRWQWAYAAADPRPTGWASPFVCGFDARGRAKLFPPEACYTSEFLRRLLMPISGLFLVIRKRRRRSLNEGGGAGQGVEEGKSMEEEKNGNAAWCSRQTLLNLSLCIHLRRFAFIVFMIAFTITFICIYDHIHHHNRIHYHIHDHIYLHIHNRFVTNLLPIRYQLVTNR